MEIKSIVLNAIRTPVEICEYHKQGGGLFNTTYVVKLLNPNIKIVLRVAPINQELLIDFETKMMSAEPFIYEIMSGAGVPVPEIIKHDDSRAIIDREYIIMKYIDGIQFSDADFPKKYTNKINFELGEYTAKIHSIKGGKFGWPRHDGSIEGDECWYGFLGLFLNNLYEKSIFHEVFNKKEIEEFNRFFRKNKDIFKLKEAPALIHNDLWAPNILVDCESKNCKIKAIIDPDRAMFGDREYEFVLWGKNPDFMRGYGISLDMSEEGVLKRRYYGFILMVINAYVYKVEYGNIYEYRKYYKKSLKEFIGINCLK